MVLELGLEGKFAAKSTGWDENRVFLEGDKLVVEVKTGRWVLTTSLGARVRRCEEWPSGAHAPARGPAAGRRAGQSPTSTRKSDGVTPK